MGYWYDAAKVKEIIKIRSFRSKITQIKSLFGCGTNKKFNILTTWNYLLFLPFAHLSYLIVIMEAFGIYPKIINSRKNNWKVFSLSCSLTNSGKPVFETGVMFRKSSDNVCLRENINEVVRDGSDPRTEQLSALTVQCNWAGQFCQSFNYIIQSYHSFPSGSRLSSFATHLGTLPVPRNRLSSSLSKNQ